MFNISCCWRITTSLIQSQCRNQQLIARCHITNFATFSHERKVSPIASWKRTNLQKLPTRNFSDEKNTKNEKQPILPDLMPLPTSFYLTSGSIWDIVKVWLTTKFLIVPKIDKEFQAKEFVIGATKAIEVVSHRLAAQEYDALQELITPEALEILRSNIGQMTEKQRSEIPITVNDIRKSYIADITVSSDRDRDPPLFTIQITLIALASKPVSEPMDGIEPNGPRPKHQLRNRKIFCAYRFIKGFSGGVHCSERQWTINLLNHVDSRDFVSKIKF